MSKNEQKPTDRTIFSSTGAGSVFFTAPRFGGNCRERGKMLAKKKGKLEKIKRWVRINLKTSVNKCDQCPINKKDVSGIFVGLTFLKNE